MNSKAEEHITDPCRALQVINIEKEEVVRANDKQKD